MLTPPMTSALARRIEQNDIDYSLSRLAGMGQAKGNPLGIEIRQYDNAIAFLIQGWPDFWYGNKVLGLETSSVNYLDDIVKFFQERNLSFRFEIMPGNMNSALASHLHKLGFCQTGFNTAVYGQPRSQTEITPSQSPEQVNVREVRPDEIDLFLDLYQDGFGLPRLNSEERSAVRSWLEWAKPNLYLCIAHVNDASAGIGVLYMNDGVGLLADARHCRGFAAKAVMQHYYMTESRLQERQAVIC